MMQKDAMDMILDTDDFPAIVGRWANMALDVAVKNNRDEIQAQYNEIHKVIPEEASLVLVSALWGALLELCAGYVQMKMMQGDGMPAFNAQKCVDNMVREMNRR